VVAGGAAVTVLNLARFLRGANVALTKKAFDEFRTSGWILAELDKIRPLNRAKIFEPFPERRKEGSLAGSENGSVIVRRV